MLMVLLVLACSEDKDAATLGRELWEAILTAPAEIDDIEDLMEDGADVNVKDHQGDTPLHYAADKGYTDIALLLLDNGADVNAVNDWGIAPLFRAAVAGHVEIAGMLVGKGADVNAATQSGDTPLDGATANGRMEVATMLLNNGAQAIITTKGGMLAKQSFEVDLPHFGEVMFASYYDPEGAGSLHFYLIKNGRAIYEFERLSGAQGSGEDVIAVAFRDMNADGNRDIIVIAAYSVRTSAGKMETLKVPGVYLYSNNAYVQSYTINEALKSQPKTIKSIIEYLMNIGQS